jgi:hypothetical protein
MTVAEHLFRISLGSIGNVVVRLMFYLRATGEEDTMKKFGYTLAALAAIVIAAPSIASAETVVIKRGGGHHGYGARAEYRGHRDHGWHGGHGNKVVIIKHGHGHRY